MILGAAAYFGRSADRLSVSAEEVCPVPGHTERNYEPAIEAGLTGSGGYETRNPEAFDETY